MSSLFGTQQKAATTQQPNQPASSMRLQSSVQGKPIPLLWGQTRIAGNLIWYGDFYSVAVQQGGTQSAGGGKGGLFGGGGSGNNAGTVTYNYYTSVAIALCEGPVTAVGQAWASKGNEANYASYGFTLFNGGYSQAAWSYLTTAHPGQDLTYHGIAYVAVSALGLGSGTDLPNYTFEVQGGIANAIAGRPDADGGAVLIDFLTNAKYGLGFPSARLDSLTWYSCYCKATGLLVSPALVDSQSANKFIADLLQATNSSARWSSGKLTVVPFGDSVVSNGSTTVTTQTSSVPAVAPFVIQVAQYGKFVADGGVSHHLGSVLTKTTSPYPSTGQYYVDQLGNYTFAAGDAGASMDIAYTYAATAGYVPSVTPLYDLTDSDFLEDQGQASTSGKGSVSQPLTVVRKARKDILNSVKVEYFDRSNNYDPATVEAKDQASIDVYGVRPSSVRQAHFLCTASTAVLSAALQLNREQIANTYTFTVGPKFVLVDVEDIVTLTRPQLGLSRQPVRVTDIQENNDGSLSFTAEEYLGTAGAPLYGSQANTGHATNTNVDPGLVNTPIIFEPTPDLIGTSQSEIWGAVSGANTSLWGGCNVYASYDNATYAFQGTINGPSRMGVLTAILANAAAGLDTTNTLSLNLTESASTLASGTAADMNAGNTACYVGGEIVSYQTATLTSQYHYDLTTMQRGFGGSTPAAHAIGTPFVRLDQGIIKIPYMSDRVGDTVYLKFQSFNVWGGGLQDLSACTAYTYLIAGSGPPPDVTNFRAATIGDTTTLTWDAVTVFNLAGYEVRFTTNTATPAWGSAVLVQTGIAGTSLVVPTQAGVYLIKAYNTLGLYSADATLIEMFVDAGTQRNAIIDNHEEPNFAGTNVNTFAAGGKLYLSGSGMMHSWPTLHAVLPSLSYYGGTCVLTGTYFFDETYDLGAVFTCRISLVQQAYGLSVAGSVMHSWATLHAVAALTQAASGGWETTTYVRSTSDDPSGTPTWSAWAQLSTSDQTARAFQFKTVLTSDDGSVTPVVTQLETIIDVPDKFQSAYNLVCAPGVQNFLYASAFHGVTGLTITAVNLSQGLGYVLSNKTTTGFSLEFVDASGTPVAYPVTFDYIARGWGSVNG